MLQIYEKKRIFANETLKNNDYDEINASCDGHQRPKRTFFERPGAHDVTIRQASDLFRGVIAYR